MAELSNYKPIINGEVEDVMEGKTKVEPMDPRDRYHLVRVTMYLFGISCLLPWNFFIQANDYWMYKFRNVSAGDITNPNDKTELQATFSSYLAIASKVPYVLFLLANTAVANRFRAENRMQYPLSVMVLLFIITIIMVPINTDSNQNAFFAITICLVIAINVLCGFVQGAGTGIAGSLPKAYMGYNVNGMAIGGVLASLAQIASLAGDTSATNSAIMYFVFAVLILIVTFILFRMTIKTDFYRFYLSKQARETDQVSGTKMTDLWKKVEVLKKISVHAIAVVLIFWVSLSVLPAVLVLISSTSRRKTIWTGKFFVPVACFFLFNAADLGGRILAQLQPIPTRYKFLTLALTMSRIVFIPLIMMCNATPRNHLPVAFGDLSLVIIIFFFAITNGYLCNVILMQAPKQVEEENQEQAGSQMAFFLGLGLMLGSVTSYGIVKLL